MSEFGYTHYWGRGRGWCVEKDCNKPLIESDFVEVTLVPRTQSTTTRGILRSVTETREKSPYPLWFWDAKAEWAGPFLRIISSRDASIMETFIMGVIESIREGKDKYHADGESN